jgi:hypothetical protein
MEKLLNLVYTFDNMNSENMKTQKVIEFVWYKLHSQMKITFNINGIIIMKLIRKNFTHTAR